MQKLQTIAAFLALVISIVALFVSCNSDRKVRQCEFLYSSNEKLTELQQQIDELAKFDNYGLFSEVESLRSIWESGLTAQEQEWAMATLSTLANERSVSLEKIRDLLTRHQYAISDHILESLRMEMNKLQDLAVKHRTHPNDPYDMLATSYRTAGNAIRGLVELIEEEHRKIAQRIRIECMK